MSKDQSSTNDATADAAMMQNMGRTKRAFLFVWTWLFGFIHSNCLDLSKPRRLLLLDVVGVVHFVVLWLSVVGAC